MLSWQIEINRAPAKVQICLVRSHARTVKLLLVDTTSQLDEPFLTKWPLKNPVEQEGTYPLPEAQVDRFIVKSCY